MCTRYIIIIIIIVKCDGIVLPNGDVMKEVDKEGYTYLGVVELDKIKENEMKEKTTKEYKRRLRLKLNSKLNGRNKIRAINAWAVAIFRCGAGIHAFFIRNLPQGLVLKVPYL